MLLLVTGLCACSALKLAYGSIDGVAYLWLDSYFDFTDDQKPRVRDDLRRVQAWHRTEELPRVVEILRQMEELASTSFTAEQACAVVPRFRERMRALAMQVELESANHARDLRAAQLAHLQRKLASKDDDFRREWVDADAADVRERRAKQLVERAETVYGPLEDSQRALVADHVARSSFDARRVLRERERRQADALQTLRRIAGHRIALDDARRMLRGYFERAMESPDAGYRRYLETVIRENCALAAALHETATPAQRESAARRLRGWQRDLRDLAAQR